jgi:hypothetical protein
MTHCHEVSLLWRWIRFACVRNRLRFDIRIFSGQIRFVGLAGRLRANHFVKFVQVNYSCVHRSSIGQRQTTRCPANALARASAGGVSPSAGVRRSAIWSGYCSLNGECTQRRELYDLGRARLGERRNRCSEKTNNERTKSLKIHFGAILEFEYSVQLNLGQTIP